MISIKIDMRTYNRDTQRIKRKLRSVIDADFNEIPEEAAEEIARRTRSAASREFDGAGHIEGSIRAVGSNVIAGGPQAPHFMPQEFGFADHYVPKKWLQESTINNANVRNPIWVKVGKSRRSDGYFFMPTIREYVDNIVGYATSNAIKETYRTADRNIGQKYRRFSRGLG